MRKRREIARTVGIVFQEEAVVVRPAEEDFGNRLVAAGREPRGAEVAAANMRGDGHVGRLRLKNAVDHGHVVAGDLIDVDALLGVRGALGRIAELAPARVVELQVAAAVFVERAHGVAIRLHDVVEERLLVDITLNRLVGGRAAHAGDEVQHGRRGDGQLGLGGAGDLFQLVEVGEERVVAKADLSAEDQLRALGLGTLELDRPGFGVDVLDVFQPLEEVEVPHGAAELAIGDGLKPSLLFLLDQIGDGRVFGGGQLLGRDGAGGEVGTRLLERFGAQEAADDVVCVGRVGDGHGGILSLLGDVERMPEAPCLENYRFSSDIHR